MLKYEEAKCCLSYTVCLIYDCFKHICFYFLYTTHHMLENSVMMTAHLFYVSPSCKRNIFITWSWKWRLDVLYCVHKYVFMVIGSCHILLLLSPWCWKYHLVQVYVCMLIQVEVRKWNTSYKSCLPHSTVVFNTMRPVPKNHSKETLKF